MGNASATAAAKLQREAMLDAVKKHNANPHRKTEAVMDPQYAGEPYASAIIGWRIKLR